VPTSFGVGRGLSAGGGLRGAGLPPRKTYSNPSSMELRRRPVVADLVEHSSSPTCPEFSALYEFRKEVDEPDRSGNGGRAND
jgi:hypothetical protein